eukprot:CAMPEP_0172725694 /NCGR_PEP_ID=MMETSP1074-20121228/88999_1 /TAXON_ID=2916 /ORGANISM="Ceratium fusus, Strain PA161109" /LENGTH=33 /DNA_ID= /DNA_START= /DNA_END= /DNA_ORIENTATION=
MAVRMTMTMSTVIMHMSMPMNVSNNRVPLRQNL